VRSRKIIPTLLFPVLFSVCSLAQGLGQRPGPPPIVPGKGDSGDNNTMQQQVARDLAKKANEDRQKTLKNDTDKLLKLASELKEDVDKSNENVLSLDVIKKAEQIEKLAHSVKEKMKGVN
jgi:hypothetical protein